MGSTTSVWFARSTRRHSSGVVCIRRCSLIYIFTVNRVLCIICYAFLALSLDLFHLDYDPCFVFDNCINGKQKFVAYSKLKLCIFLFCNVLFGLPRWMCANLFTIFIKYNFFFFCTNLTLYGRVV